MIPLAIVAGLLVVLVAFLLLDRSRERRQPNPDVEQLIALVDRLCVRIQAPQRSAIEGLNEPVAHQSPVAVNPELDDEYWESREALADRLMGQEVDG